MKKKLLSLALAVALCLSLAIPALAVTENGGYICLVDDNSSEHWYDSYTGNGWSFNGKTTGPALLKLSGVKQLSFEADGAFEIELAAGTKSELRTLTFNGDVTFKGTGEVEIVALQGASMVMWVFNGNIKLADGLVATGGAKAGDSGPLTIKTYADDGAGPWQEFVDSNGNSAKYIHIGPAAGAAAATGATKFTDVAANSPFVDAINWAVEKGITNGTTGTTFSPSNTCTTAQILTFLYRAAGSPNKGENERASVTAWANGKGLDTSSLDAPCTRSAAVTYMWKAAGSPKPSKTSSFADVSAGADYAQAVSWAVEKGITNGTGGNSFSPNQTCTRGQIVTFLYRYLAG